MRIKDMQPNTAYATCDGQMVVTYDTVETGWCAYTESVRDPNTGVRSDITRVEKGLPATGTDPWGSCSGGSRNGVSVHVRNGVRVKVFDYDADGNKVGKAREWVVRLSDVPGTWLEYLALHAEDVRKRKAREALEKGREERAKEIQRALGRLGIVNHPYKKQGSTYVRDTVNVDVHVDYDDPTRYRETVTISGKSLEALLAKASRARRRSA